MNAKTEMQLYRLIIDRQIALFHRYVEMDISTPVAQATKAELDFLRTLLEYFKP